MLSFLLLPRRCLSCGAVASSETLCRGCEARYHPGATSESGLGHCRICGQILLAETEKCVDCVPVPWTFPQVDGLVGYQEPRAELLRLYKFGGLSGFAKPWARASVPRLVPPGPLIPVPSTRGSVWRRGWDPVATFVRKLGKEAGLPVWDVLVRRSSLVQKRLDRRERFKNVRSAYRLKADALKQLGGCPTVWLIDDVVTTGATVEACSQLLRKAGVHEVRVLCLGLH